MFGIAEFKCLDRFAPGRLFQRLDHICMDPRIEHIVEEPDLPARKITDEEYEQAKRDYAPLKEKWDVITALGPEAVRARENSRTYTLLSRSRRVIERCEAQGCNPTFGMELHALRVGDIAMVTNPFELFLDFGLRMKARSKVLQTFVVQLACGRGLYLPTRRAMSGKDFGAGPVDNEVGPDGGEMLVNRTVQLIARLWAE